MARWRKRTMALEEWGPLQERVGELQMSLHGDPELAMFSKQEPGEHLTTIYITAPYCDVLERYAPGDWQATEAPEGENVSMLVGTADAWERFGIQRK